MAFDWEQYLALARRLAAAAGPTEADLRTAVSRAYYAAFNRARVLAGQQLPSAEGSHERVWRELERAHDRERMAIGKSGSRLKQERVRADYRSGESVTLPEARTAIEMAESLIRKIERVRQLESGGR